ncbi:MAG: hypothetical protein IH944_12090 [Armatimonadetes bacterium]|nr:hypothetical protein [Armatimonadota bacterium]
MAAQDQNKVCPKCFEVNDPAATFCVECGVPLSDEPGAEGSDAEVYREITQANLHRIRGDYKAAINQCLTILKRYPNNGTAHTLLGDIYAEQGDLEQSSQWFEMALDLRPESENDQRKLESVQQRITQQEAAESAEQLGLPTTKPRAQQYVFLTAIFIAIIGVVGFFLGTNLAQAGDPDTNSIISETIDVTPGRSPDGSSEEPSPTEVTAPWAATDGTSLAEITVMGSINQQLGGLPRVVRVTKEMGQPFLEVTAAIAQTENPEQVATQIVAALMRSYDYYQEVKVRLMDGQHVLWVGTMSTAAYVESQEEGGEPAIFYDVWRAGG